MSKPKPRSKSAATKHEGGRAASPKSPRAKPRARAAAAGAASAQAEAEAAARPRQRPDDGDAFMPDPGEGPARSTDDLAEVLAEDFLESATRGNEVFEDEIERPLSDEVGGPFVVTDEGEELVDDVDESNPVDAEPAPRPTAVAGLVQRPRAEELAEDEEEDEQEDEEEDEEGDEDPDEDVTDEHEHAPDDEDDDGDEDDKELTTDEDDEDRLR
jgi:hypothetical protein